MTILALPFKYIDEDGAVVDSSFTIAQPVRDEGTWKATLTTDLLPDPIPCVGETPFGAISNACLFIEHYLGSADNKRVQGVRWVGL